MSFANPTMRAESNKKTAGARGKDRRESSLCRGGRSMWRTSYIGDRSCPKQIYLRAAVRGRSCTRDLRAGSAASRSVLEHTARARLMCFSTILSEMPQWAAISE